MHLRYMYGLWRSHTILRTAAKIEYYFMASPHGRLMSLSIKGPPCLSLRGKLRFTFKENIVTASFLLCTGYCGIYAGSTFFSIYIPQVILHSLSRLYDGIIFRGKMASDVGLGRRNTQRRCQGIGGEGRLEEQHASMDPALPKVVTVFLR